MYLYLSFTVHSQAITSLDKFIIAGHSHNDYRQCHPLEDALRYHFKSIEADVFAVGDSLFVAHDECEITKGRTLRSLYLDPLLKRVAENKGSVYGNGVEILLMIDIKRDANASFLLLENILSDYKNILTSYNNGRIEQGAVRVIISGERAIDLLQEREIGVIFLDGRINDLDNGLPAHLMPVVSGSWRDFFVWNGRGSMLPKDEKKLIELSSKVREYGCLIRFWATPDASHEVMKNVWECLYNHQVELIGTDDLQRLNKFLIEKTVN